MELNEQQQYVSDKWDQLIELTDKKVWDQADDLFEEIRAFAKSHNMRYFELHLMYANYLVEINESARAFSHLNFLKDLYLQAGVTETAYLSTRGIPDFNDFIIVSTNFLQANPVNLQKKFILEDLKGALDESGSAEVEKVLNSL